MNSQLSKLPLSPPPPPPLPRNGNLLKLNELKNRNFMIDNKNNQYSNSIKIATIKPTTAGLLKFPAVEDNNITKNMQQVPGNSVKCSSPTNLMGSQLFKNELLQKQSKMSNVTSQSIDDRLKARKEEERNMYSYKDKGMLIDLQQINNMPEKLMSTFSREKQPFSYSSDVNDPNSKGKLDLAKIKSPIMRRRLLVNMNSTDKSEDKEVESDLEVKDNDHERNIEQCQKPVQNNKIESSATIVHNQCIRQIDQPTAQGQPKPSPIIRYNQPPLFYNSVNNPVKIPSNQDTSHPDVKFNQSSNSHNGCIDKLNLEVAESLDSLSMLVANLPGPKTQTGGRLSNYEHRHHLHSPEQYQRSQSSCKRSTFLPHDFYCNSKEYNRHNSRSISPDTSYQASNNRSIGDYLLSPNSNYFATSSNTLPYTLASYYGNTLEPEICNFNTHASSNSSSGKDFSPINRRDNSFSNRYNPINKNHFL